ncbi:MAG: DUF2891 domain-containing protein [Planctomycetes bacterium]|nr:DUF2891 domain-containing protein [Planctomycetota bacterium]
MARGYSPDGGDSLPDPVANAGAVTSTFTDEQAETFSKLALSGLHREYPNKPSNVLASAEDVKSPKALHPAFYGCFDWHSSVHGHWMLVRLLKSNPGHGGAKEARSAIDQSLTRENIAVEVAYFEQKENKSFERMYGWAWLLRLAAELHEWDDVDAKRWRATIVPLEEKIVALTVGYLPRLSKPIRTGVHPDTAFAFGQILDYALIVKNESLERAIRVRAMQFYADDFGYASQYEPSGEDFFSAGLNEADLMRRILSRDEFDAWLRKFLPFTDGNSHREILTPVVVSDVTDGKLVHLAGLNLSRAWCLNGIAASLPQSSSLRSVFAESANRHEQAGLGYVFSGHYEGEHWLGTFAVYTLSRVGITRVGITRGSD